MKLHQLKNLVRLTAHQHLTNRPRLFTQKGFQDFVTNIDILVQEALCERLEKEYPVISEEKMNNLIPTDGNYWIVDPVDGTTNLLHNYQSSTISVALFKNHNCVQAVVYNPFTQEMFSAEKGKGATLNGELIHVSGVDSITRSLIGFGMPYDKQKGSIILDKVGNLFESCQDIKRHGPASLDLCYVASGRLDAYLELDLKAWDIAAGSLILKEAGGYVKEESLWFYAAATKTLLRKISED